MKSFFLSLFFAASGLLGFNKEKPKFVTIEITPTPVIIIPTLAPEPTIKETPIVTVESSPLPTKRIVSPSSLKPTALVTEEVLRVFFNMNNDHEINLILNNKDKISEYEKYYYQKHKNFPIPKLKIIVNKLYTLPNKNGFVVCDSNQLKSLYDELSKYEEDFAYKKMDSKCHYGNNKEKESQECQDWRRDHDQNRKNPTAGSLEEKITEMTAKLKERDNLWDSLLEKYCTKK